METGVTGSEELGNLVLMAGKAEGIEPDDGSDVRIVFD